MDGKGDNKEFNTEAQALARDLGLIEENQISQNGDAFDNLEKAIQQNTGKTGGSWFAPEVEDGGNNGGEGNTEQPEEPVVKANEAAAAAQAAAAAEESETANPSEAGTTETVQPNGAEQIREVLKSHLGAEADLTILDGDDVIGALAKGFSEAQGETNLYVSELTELVKSQAEVIENQGKLLLMLGHGLVSLKKSVDADNDENRTIMREFAKAVDNIPVNGAPRGLIGILDRYEGAEQGVTIAKAMGAVREDGAVDNDKLMTMVEKSLNKSDADKTPGERMLDPEKHLVVGRAGYKALPKAYREEVGLPTD